jgi:predicted ArsR family transcriptional regulator
LTQPPPVPPELPACVTEIIRRHLHSVLDIETLLLLRSQPGVPWSARDLCIALYITEEAASDHLAKLHASGLLGATDGGTQTVLYRYEPRDEGLAQAVDQLAVAYAQRRVRVIEYLYSRPLHSVRSFASAFRLKRARQK